MSWPNSQAAQMNCQNGSFFIPDLHFIKNLTLLHFFLQIKISFIFKSNKSEI